MDKTDNDKAKILSNNTPLLAIKAMVAAVPKLRWWVIFVALFSVINIMDFFVSVIVMWDSGDIASFGLVLYKIGVPLFSLAAVLSTYNVGKTTYGMENEIPQANKIMILLTCGIGLFSWSFVLFYVIRACMNWNYCLSIQPSPPLVLSTASLFSTTSGVLCFGSTWSRFVATTIISVFTLLDVAIAVVGLAMIALNVDTLVKAALRKFAGDKSKELLGESNTEASIGEFIDGIHHLYDRHGISPLFIYKPDKCYETEFTHELGLGNNNTQVYKSSTVYQPEFENEIETSEESEDEDIGNSMDNMPMIDHGTVKKRQEDHKKYKK
jgi:hypothetical protein